MHRPCCFVDNSIIFLTVYDSSGSSVCFSQLNLSIMVQSAVVFCLESSNAAVYAEAMLMTIPN